MKIFKYKFIITCFATLSLLCIMSCTQDFEKINTNPNDPEDVPTNMIFNNATSYLMNYTRDGWWSARMSLPWMQYSAQILYQEEDKYQYRETQTDNGWFYLFKTATDLKSIIEINENEETAEQAAAYGEPGNQIAVSRIMLAYIFDQLASHFGDVPYWSYSDRDNPDYQALDIDKYLQPKYAAQEKIYPDILKELKEAAGQLVSGKPVFNSGDNIYHGNADQWKKFANSLRLRIANRIKKVYPDAQNHITELTGSDDLILSNADNAVQEFGASSTEGSPFWKTFMVGKRQDFVATDVFINLLKGNSATNFGLDPRLPKMIAPVGFDGYAVEAHAYEETPFSELKANSSLLDQYVGMPVGLPNTLVEINSAIGETSFFSYHVIKPDFGEVLMEAAEVYFLLSENAGWDEEFYEKGVRASMEKWGVESGEIDQYIAGLPSAAEENVLTQKYIALFMQPQEAWNEYRRTGYPNGDVLLLPGETNTDLFGTEYVMTPLNSGNVTTTDLPDRVRYPNSEENINAENYAAARKKLNNGDEINSRLWWSR